MSLQSCSALQAPRDEANDQDHVEVEIEGVGEATQILRKCGWCLSQMRVWVNISDLLGTSDTHKDHTKTSRSFDCLNKLRNAEEFILRNF